MDLLLSIIPFYFGQLCDATWYKQINFSLSKILTFYTDLFLESFYHILLYHTQNSGMLDGILLKVHIN
jgi:hypothetical protein